MKKKITPGMRILAAVGFIFMSISGMYVYFSGIDKSMMTIATSALCIAAALYEMKRLSEMKNSKGKK